MENGEFFLPSEEKNESPHPLLISKSPFPIDNAGGIRRIGEGKEDHMHGLQFKTLNQMAMRNLETPPLQEGIINCPSGRVESEVPNRKFMSTTSLCFGIVMSAFSLEKKKLKNRDIDLAVFAPCKG